MRFGLKRKSLFSVYCWSTCYFHDFRRLLFFSVIFRMANKRLGWLVALFCRDERADRGAGSTVRVMSVLYCVVITMCRDLISYELIMG